MQMECADQSIIWTTFHVTVWSIRVVLLNQKPSNYVSYHVPYAELLIKENSSYIRGNESAQNWRVAIFQFLFPLVVLKRNSMIVRNCVCVSSNWVILLEVFLRWKRKESSEVSDLHLTLLKKETNLFKRRGVFSSSDTFITISSYCAGANCAGHLTRHWPLRSLKWF